MKLSLLAWIPYVNGKTVPVQNAEKMAKDNKDFSKFMPKPTGHGFDDAGMTRGAAFDEGAQMNRFGIPDLKNPITKELTDLDFEFAMHQNEYLAVLFYEEKMSEYEYAALHWEKASMEMNQILKVYTTANITMARFDIAEPEHKDIALLYKVADRPIMKMFYQGKFLVDVTCPVQHHEIRQFIVAQTIPPVEELETKESLMKWKRRKQINQSNLKFLAFFNEDDSKMKAFIELGKRLRSKIQFARVKDEKLFTLATKVEGDVTSGQVMFFRDFDTPSQIPYTSDLKIASLIQFVRQYNMPLLTNMGDDQEFRVRDFMEHPAPWRLIAFFKSDEQMEAHRSGLETIANELHDPARVAFSVEAKEDGINFDYSFWEIDGKQPTVIYYHVIKDRKYVWSNPDALTLDSMRSFMAAIKDGSITPQLKSQVEPAVNSGPVRILTTTTYVRDVYEKNTQDTMVLFYMPGQRNSDWMLSQVTKFAKVWRREKRFSIAGVDCTQNDIISVDPAVYPTLYFVSASNKTNGILTTELSLPSKIRYPDAQQLMTFVRSATTFDDLKQDDKIWNILVEEDRKVYENLAKKEEEMKSNDDAVEEELKVEEEELNVVEEELKVVDEELKVVDEEIKVVDKEIKVVDEELKVLDEEIKNEKARDKKGPSKFGKSFDELKRRVLQEEAEDEVDTGTAMEHNQFPGSFNEFQVAQNIVGEEVASLFKSTGHTIPESFDETFDPSTVQTEFPWYHSVFILFNLVMISLFGDGIAGGAFVMSFLLTLTFGLPALWNWNKKRQMTIWLTAFYQEHNPSHIERVSTIVNIFSSMPNGTTKMKEELMRKYLLNADSGKKNK